MLTLFLFLLQRHEPDRDMREACKMSFEGFARFLMDKANYAFIDEYAQQDLDVSTFGVDIVYHIENTHSFVVIISSVPWGFM